MRPSTAVSATVRGLARLLCLLLAVVSDVTPFLRKRSCRTLGAPGLVRSQRLAWTEIGAVGVYGARAAYLVVGAARANVLDPRRSRRTIAVSRQRAMRRSLSPVTPTHLVRASWELKTASSATGQSGRTAVPAAMVPASATGSSNATARTEDVHVRVPSWRAKGAIRDPTMSLLTDASAELLSTASSGLLESGRPVLLPVAPETRRGSMAWLSSLPTEERCAPNRCRRFVSAMLRKTVRLLTGTACWQTGQTGAAANLWVLGVVSVSDGGMSRSPRLVWVKTAKAPHMKWALATLNARLKATGAVGQIGKSGVCAPRLVAPEVAAPDIVHCMSLR
mmetsp:Transcript_66681/g.148069  ORF Transcript_66681/g.148069 Transcript_66681/m.148069 type:complete len:335 (+) Transcript_66681:828-1832(+)